MRKGIVAFGGMIVGLVLLVVAFHGTMVYDERERSVRE